VAAATIGKIVPRVLWYSETGSAFVSRATSANTRIRSYSLDAGDRTYLYRGRQ